MQFEPIADAVTVVDLGALETVTGAQSRGSFSWKNLAAWTGTGFAAGATGGSVACLAAGPAYPACVGLSALGGAATAAVWNTAAQTGVLDYGK